MNEEDRGAVSDFGHPQVDAVRGDVGLFERKHGVLRFGIGGAAPSQGSRDRQPPRSEQPDVKASNSEVWEGSLYALHWLENHVVQAGALHAASWTVTAVASRRE